MNTLPRLLLAMIVALASLGAMSERAREAGVTDGEIRIGNLMPYSGGLSVFGAIGKAEAAYFDLLNERGGINGRKVRFISYDDKSDPASAMKLTRDLVEEDKVLLMFGSFGTPGNFAVRQYLNDRQIPQLFVASGDDHLSDPSLFPWTMGWQPSLREEGASTPTTSRRSTRESGSSRSGKTIISAAKSSREWRTGSARSPA
jgi:ABC-type branched-subunit amino acid transport system substrate-binding protein